MRISIACRFALASIALTLMDAGPVFADNEPQIKADKLVNETQSKLDTLFEIDKPTFAPLNDVLELLSHRFDLRIVFDKEAFAKEKMVVPKDARINLPKLPKATLDTLLRLSLAGADAVYEVRGKTVVVVPNKEDAKPREFPRMSEARMKAIKAQCAKLAEKTLDIDRPIDATLLDITEFIEDRCGFKIVFDERAFRKQKINNDIGGTRVKLQPTRGSFDMVMRTLLGQVKGIYEFHGDHIRIVPRDEREP